MPSPAPCVLSRGKPTGLGSFLALAWQGSKRAPPRLTLIHQAFYGLADRQHTTKPVVIVSITWGIVVPIRRTEIDLRIIVPRTTAQHTVVFTDRLLLQVLTRSPRRRAGTVPTKSSKIKKVVFHREISARFAVKESGSKRGEGKEPSRQTTHNETRSYRLDHVGY